MAISAHIANILTGSRLILAPCAGFCLWYGGISPLPAKMANASAMPQWTALALLLILVAALTDLLDGMAARKFNAHSKLGRLLDPLADKLLCWSVLIALAILAQGAMLILLPTALIILRDTLISVLRLTAKDGEGPPPSRAAKYKTALEMLILIAAPALALAGAPEPWSQIWCAGLAGCAALAVWTGIDYLRIS